MKNFYRSALVLSVVTNVLVASSAQALTLQVLSKRNVADANYCGDFNVLRTYSLGLSQAERFPAPSTALLTPANLELLEKELREHFVAPSSGGKLVILASGLKALDKFANSPSGNQDACFDEDFGELFSYSYENQRLESTDPLAVSYLQLAIRNDDGSSSTPATVVIDRRQQKLYIHQIW